MYQCHCAKCRAASGASFVTNIIVDAAKFTITAGKGSLAGFESSPQGSLLLLCRRLTDLQPRREDEAGRSVRCGTLKQDPGVRVAYHAFVDSKAAWNDICDELPHFAEWPDPELVRRLFNGGPALDPLSSWLFATAFPEGGRGNSVSLSAQRLVDVDICEPSRNAHRMWNEIAYPAMRERVVDRVHVTRHGT